MDEITVSRHESALIRGVQQGRRRVHLTRKGMETINGILSEPVGERFLTMLGKPKEEKGYGEAKLPKERRGTTLLSFSPSLLGFGLLSLL